MYKLKDGMDWEDIRQAIRGDNTLEDYFEKTKLSKVEYKKCGIKISEHKELNIDGFGMIRIFDYCTGITQSVLIGGEIIETIQDFNEKCSQLFGFELIETKESINENC